MTVGTPDLGPFAPDRGPVQPVAAAGATLGVAAAVLAGARPMVNVLTAGELAWATDLAVSLGVVAVITSMTGQYLAITRARRGFSLARVGALLGGASIVIAFVYGAVRDGTVRLDRVVESYFDMEIVARVWWPMIRTGMVNTLRAALAAEVFAIAVGLLVATFALSPRRVFRIPAVWYTDFVRGTPIIVHTFLLYGGLGFVGIVLPPFTAVVAILTVNASGYIAEIFRAGIQAVPKGQWDAARSLGMPHATTLLFVVLPQAVRAVIPPLMSEFIAIVKDSAIAYVFVGVTASSADIFFVGRTAAASTFNATPYFVAAVAYLLITIPLSRLVGIVERRLRVGLA